MSNAKDIIEWFATYRLEQGLDTLLEARRELSIVCVSIAEAEKKAVSQYHTLYQERKIAEAKSKITNTGTILEKESAAIVEHEQLRIDEAIAESEAKGAKIMLGSYNKVLDSMASMINVLNR